MKLKTNGYRGPGTKYAFLPAGEYTVGKKTDAGRGIVSQALADEMLGIGLAEVTEQDAAVGPNPAQEQPPAETEDTKKKSTSRKRTTKPKPDADKQGDDPQGA